MGRKSKLNPGSFFSLLREHARVLFSQPGALFFLPRGRVGRYELDREAHVSYVYPGCWPASLFMPIARLFYCSRDDMYLTSLQIEFRQMRYGVLLLFDVLVV